MRLFLVRMMMMEIMMILVLTLSNFDAFLTQTHKTNSLKLETLYDIKPQKIFLNIKSFTL